MKNRMREICTSGSVRGGGGNVPTYSAFQLHRLCWQRAAPFPAWPTPSIPFSCLPLGLPFSNLAHFLPIAVEGQAACLVRSHRRPWCRLVGRKLRKVELVKNRMAGQCTWITAGHTGNYQPCHNLRPTETMVCQSLKKPFSSPTTGRDLILKRMPSGMTVHAGIGQTRSISGRSPRDVRCAGLLWRRHRRRYCGACIGLAVHIPSERHFDGHSPPAG